MESSPSRINRTPNRISGLSISHLTGLRKVETKKCAKFRGGDLVAENFVSYCLEFLIVIFVTAGGEGTHASHVHSKKLV